MKTLPLLLAGLVAPVTPAAHADTWLNLGGVTWHNRTGLNGNNPALGVETDVSARGFAAAGFYRNSLSETSHYFVYGYRFLDSGRLSAGGVVGVVDGYWARNGGNYAPMAVPFVSLRWWRASASVIVAPPAVKDGAVAVALQIKIKVL